MLHHTDLAACQCSAVQFFLRQHQALTWPAVTMMLTEGNWHGRGRARVINRMKESVQERKERYV